ncbi:MAG: glycosyltransferase family 39 protein [Thermodesulfobacteriota bacterium]|nr:glycosyltransferase family 39 protein [Thermodesulfobacteriota bacterium]
MKNICHSRKEPRVFLHIVLGSILLSGLLVRLYGINFGLPFLYNPDEYAFVNPALHILKTFDFNPHWFGHPGTTTIYLLVFLYGLIYVGGLGLGVFSKPDDFAVLINGDPTIIYLSGRLLFALVGVATILVVYFIACRMYNKRTGLIAAAFLSFSPLHVLFSKLIRTDILMTFFLLVTFLFCLRILEKRAWSDYLAAGLITGFAVATKYPAVVIILVIVTAHILSAPSQWAHLLKLSASGLACLLGTFLASPFLFLDFETTWRNVMGEARPTHLSATGSGFFHDLAWYICNALCDALSPAGLILAGIGIFLCLLSMRRDKWLLMIFPFFFLLFISALSLRWSRWVIPVVPFLCVFAAHTLYRISDWVGRHSTPVLGVLVSVGLTVGFVTPLVKADLVQGRELSNKDTRTLAREWILDNIPTGSRILVEKYTPHLPKERYVFLQAKNGYPAEVDTSKIHKSVFTPGFTKLGTLKDPQKVMEKNVQYMVLSNWYERFLAEEDEHSKIVAANYETLMSMATKIYEVRSTPGENSGPTIRIYRFGTAR